MEGKEEEVLEVVVVVVEVKVEVLEKEKTRASSLKDRIQFGEVSEEEQTTGGGSPGNKNERRRRVDEVMGKRKRGWRVVSSMGRKYVGVDWAGNVVKG
ncbi:hypothetical protein Pcinc_030333 [Petrolisthes cinctipes]|uniref:Uncharacterized protein n=1 Tax=Petrolisthes cinctipes TaxID=88211 RepID=A0AAE1EYB7_PETCI|nr:hypothetical protein Pcinc_030333 [Petrolisthes cinctipes]